MNKVPQAKRRRAVRRKFDALRATRLILSEACTLPGNARLVLLCLVRHASYDDSDGREPGEAWPSLSTIAAETGLSKPVVARAMTGWRGKGAERGDGIGDGGSVTGACGEGPMRLTWTKVGKVKGRRVDTYMFALEKLPENWVEWAPEDAAIVATTATTATPEATVVDSTTHEAASATVVDSTTQRSHSDDDRSRIDYAPSSNRLPKKVREESHPEQSDEASALRAHEVDQVEGPSTPSTQPTASEQPTANELDHANATPADSGKVGARLMAAVRRQSAARATP